MRTATAVIRAELGRLTATPLARLAFIALMVVPLLYGGAYLWANQDPYAKLDQLPAAIVNNDTGATNSDGDRVTYGHDVAQEALDGGDFDWTSTTSKDAGKGVRSGKYDFVVTIPADFSRSLVSASGDDPVKARIVMTTADTNSYLASTIAEQAGKTLRTAVAQRVGKEAANTLLVGLSDVRTQIGKAASGAASLADGAASAASGASSLADGAAQLSSGASSLASGTASLPSQTAALSSGAAQVASGASSLSSGLSSAASQTASLPSQTAALASGASKVAAGNKALADTTDPLLAQLDALSPDSLIAQLTAAGVTLTPSQEEALRATLADSDVQQQITAVRSDLSKIDELRDGSAQVASGASALASAAPTLSDGISSAATGAATLSDGASQVADGTSQLAAAAPTLSSGAASLASGASSLDSGASSLASGTSDLSDGASTLASSLADGQKQIPASTSSSRDKQASVISDPVKVSDDDVASAGTYGAGLAPFFISLAAWIGMYALFLILKPISKRAITAVRRPLATTLGAWLTPALLGFVQMVALFLIVRFALGFGVVHTGGTIAMMVLASATFAAIIMALNVMLGSVGQFLGLVLMLLQLVTAGGTFPWQTLPAPLAALHHALPMTYSVDALRQLMYGGSLSTAWSDAGVLACWLVGALAVTAAIAARQSRTRTLRDLRPSLIG